MAVNTVAERRSEALDQALRLPSVETADEAVEVAEKFFTFLSKTREVD